MRIIISGYIGKKVTGIGRNIISLIEKSDFNDEFIIYTNYDIINEFNIVKDNVLIKTYNISKYKSLQNLLWTTFIFPFIAIHERATIAVIPNFTLLLFKFIPTVIFLHDLIEFNVPNKFSKLKMFYRKKLADPISSFISTGIITVSQNSKNDIIKFLRVSQNKINIVYNGVDRKKFYPFSDYKSLEILKSKDINRGFVLYTGTIDHPGKNVLGIVKAYELLRDDAAYNGDLILAGMPGSGYEVVNKYMSQSPYSSSIKNLGYVTDDELVALFSLCDVFCFVSFYEGFGMPPLEAAACGARIVASNTSSMPEIVGEFAELVDPASVVSIRNGIENQLHKSDTELANYKNLIENKLNIFDWRNQYQKFIDVLYGIVNNR